MSGYRGPMDGANKAMATRGRGGSAGGVRRSPARSSGSPAGAPPARPVESAGAVPETYSSPTGTDAE